MININVTMTSFRNPFRQLCAYFNIYSVTGVSYFTWKQTDHWNIRLMSKVEKLKRRSKVARHKRSRRKGNSVEEATLLRGECIATVRIYGCFITLLALPRVYCEKGGELVSDELWHTQLSAGFSQTTRWDSSQILLFGFCYLLFFLWKR